MKISFNQTNDSINTQVTAGADDIGQYGGFLISITQNQSITINARCCEGMKNAVREVVCKSGVLLVGADNAKTSTKEVMTAWGDNDLLVSLSIDNSILTYSHHFRMAQVGDSKSRSS